MQCFIIRWKHRNLFIQQANSTLKCEDLLQPLTSSLHVCEACWCYDTVYNVIQQYLIILIQNTTKNLMSSHQKCSGCSVSVEGSLHYLSSRGVTPLPEPRGVHWSHPLPQLLQQWRPSLVPLPGALRLPWLWKGYIIKQQASIAVEPHMTRLRCYTFLPPPPVPPPPLAC